MKKRWALLLSMCIICLCWPQKVSASSNPEEQMMTNKNQDVLFVGTVKHVDRDVIVLKVPDYMNLERTSDSIAKREKDHEYLIPKDMAITYRWSYHGKETVEVGDCIVASLKKESGRWQISNGLYETDTDVYQELSFEPFHKDLDFEKTKLKYFMNSDGKYKDFTANKEKSKFYYKQQKIYDVRWNMKKYLTIEEIRNAEKLKAMDQDANIIETSAKTTDDGKQRLLTGFALFAAVWAFIVHRRGKRKKDN